MSSLPRRSARRPFVARWPGPGTRAAVLQLAQQVRVAGLASVAVLLAGNALWCTQVWAQPAPRVPANALPSGLNQASGTPLQYSAPAVDAKTGITSATLKQTDANNIVNWERFDIGAAARLNIVQPSANAVLLNKVSGGAFQNKTVIDGVMNANGRVYLYNPNGIVFGKTATVDVNTLIASSLKFDENRVKLGLLQPAAAPVLGVDATLGRVPGAVVVEGDALQRAALNAGNGGLLMLAGPQVVNNGLLQAPDGQVMLVAGSKVYLAAPQIETDPNDKTKVLPPRLRGLVVEVSNDDLAGLPAAGARSAENGVSGEIRVGHGNATMIGYAVNQSGTISASTSVNLNGSVYLLARDQAKPKPLQPGEATASLDYVATRNGQLVLGENSLIEIKPDAAAPAGAKDETRYPTILPSAQFVRSEVAMVGEDIRLQRDAKVLAQGGKVSISAQRLDPDAELPGTPLPVNALKDNVRVDLAAGSVIDVSGSRGAQLSMESNVVTVELRGTELADNVVLRGSPLYGKKVDIDIRKGSPAANVAGWIGQVGKGIGEVNAAGGSVDIAAGGAIIQRAGSKISVDGGYVDYLPGYVNTSQLQLGDKLVDVGAAAAGVAYTGIVKLANGESNFEAGYRQGSSAGKVSFTAPLVVQQGDLSGKTQAGANQRDVSAANYPRGGQLLIGLADQARLDGTPAYNTLAEALVLNGTGSANAMPPQVGAAFDAGNADHRQLSNSLQLDTDRLAAAGFTRLSALSNASIEVAGPLQLGAGGSLALRSAERVSVNAPVTIPSGTLDIGAADVVQLGAGVAVDLAGRWVNDSGVATPALDAAGNPTTPVALKGGKLSVKGRHVQVGAGFAADVSAGAWLNAKGGMRLGTAGSIKLNADPGALTSQVASASLRMGEGVSLRGYGFGSGGTLSLTGRNVSVGTPLAGSPVDDLNLPASFFAQGGFSAYEITANLNLGVRAGTLLRPQAQSWVMSAQAAGLSSGAMGSVANAALLSLAGPAAVRPSTSLSLAANAYDQAGYGRLLIDNGVRIELDPGARLDLWAGRQLTVLGTLRAPAGTVRMGLHSGGAAEKSLWFGPKAQVLADGSSARLYLDGAGVSAGELLGGGSIVMADWQNSNAVLDAYIVAEAGAQFSVDGISASGRVLRTGSGLSAPQTLGSAGGSIEMRTDAGLLFEGQLSGSAGGGGANAGQLTVELGNAGEALPAQLHLYSKLPFAIVPNGLAPNQPILGEGDRLVGSAPSGQGARYAGEGWLAASAFSGGGFGRIELKSADTISFGLGKSGMTLSARDALLLNAPNLKADRDPEAFAGTAGSGNSLTVRAPYVQLGSADEANQRSAAAQAGNASLAISANNIDLIGQSALQGFAAAKLSAADDIRLVGLRSKAAIESKSATAAGGFAMQGDLSLESAQTYPTTLSDFKLAVAAIDNQPGSGHLGFLSNGRSAQPVLSAAGSVTALAPYINQAGRLLAPFGSITLGNVDARLDPILTNEISYRAGSVTSVAGAGNVPLGTVVNASVPTASEWQAGLPDGTQVSLTQVPANGGGLPQRALPAKGLVSHANAISVAEGALLDASGGGNLFAYGFTAGRGGSQDVLAATDANGKPTVWAIMPSFRGTLAPVDGNYGDGGLKAGDSVTLSGMPGLPAGTYTLLPAHYALLPGAYSITLAAGTRDMPAASNLALADGSQLVSGHLGRSGAGTADTRSQGFVISSGEVLRSKSEFQLYDANSYFAGKALAAGLQLPELPRDGGYLGLDARGSVSASIFSSALSLAGQMHLNAASGGRGGMADFAAPRLEVVSRRDGGSQGASQLLAADLNGLGAESLMLGALRGSKDSAGVLQVGAEQVTVSNDAAHALSAADITLVANKTVATAAGASVRASGELARAPQDLSLPDNGALLRVSNGRQVAVTRGGTISQGSVDIAAGSTLAAAGSVYLDAGANIALAGELQLGPQAALGFGVPSISLGQYFPSEVLARSGLHLDNSQLQGFGGLASLSFNSYGKLIDLYGNVALGGAGLGQLTLQGGGLNGHGGAGVMQAGTVVLKGAAAGNAGAVNHTGSLSLLANTLLLGDQNFQLRNFESASLVAQGEFLASGANGQLSTDGDLQLAAQRFGAAAGSSNALLAGGDLRIGHTGSAGGSSVAAGAGGTLGFAARNISVGADIAIPSGTVEMVAQNLLELRGGRISTAGAQLDLGSSKATAAGGHIGLTAAEVRLAGEASLDVSALGADAGSLRISAQREVRLDGQLLGQSTPGADGRAHEAAQFALQATNPGASGEFAALNAKLNAGGFTGAREFRYAQGDVRLTGSDLVQAHKVSISTDDGSIRIDGQAQIDASGAKGGEILLQAAQRNAAGHGGQVSLGGDASLLANATTASSSEAGSLGQGGRVLIATSNADGSAVAGVGDGASIHLDGGSIDVSGAGAGRGGSIVLRAPRLNTGRDVAVASLGSERIGADSTVIEAVKVYQASTISESADGGSNLDAGQRGAMYQDASRLAARSATVLKRLKVSDVALQPGIEVRSRADDALGKLTVSVNELATARADRGWNLADWRFNGQPVALTLRAAGDLNIIGSISDGFVKPPSDALNDAAMPNWALGSGPSASLRLVGGADLAAADALAVNQVARGDVHLGFADRQPGSLRNDDAPVALVRTGTGRIDVAAARDLKLDMAKFYVDGSGAPLFYDKTWTDSGINYYQVSVFGAALYTAGAADAAAASNAPRNTTNNHYRNASSTVTSPAAFGAGGGAIDVAVGRDVVGPHNLDANWFYRNAIVATAEVPTPGLGQAVPLPRAASPLVNNWLFRQGSGRSDGQGDYAFDLGPDGRPLSTAWWSRPDYFTGGLATLGGGDLSIAAGRHVVDLNASVATNASIDRSSGSLRELGGGDLSVRAGSDIQGGAFYVQKGLATLTAGRSITVAPASAFVDPGDASNPGYRKVTPAAPHAPLLAVGDARFELNAGADLRIDGAYNPSLAMQSTLNTRSNASGSGSETGQESWFSSYGNESALKLTSFGGTVTLRQDVADLSAGFTQTVHAGQYLPAPGVPSAGATLPFTLMSSFLAPDVRIAALSGDVHVQAGFVMAPSASGQLELLAAQNVTLDAGARPFAIKMSDADPALLSGPLQPRALSAVDLGLFNGTEKGVFSHATAGLHQGDEQAARIVALHGDVVGSASVAATLDLSKSIEVRAGRDVRDLGLVAQNLRADERSSVTAGRDIIDSTSPDKTGSPVAHVVGGGGSVALLAGRHIDLGNGRGWVTRGNLDNPFLAEGGASLQAVAGGAQPDFARFVNLAQHYGSAKDIGSAAELKQLSDYLRSLKLNLAAEAGAEQVWDAFRGLPPAAQASYLQSHAELAARVQARSAMLSQALASGDQETIKAAFFASLVESSKLGQRNADNSVKPESLKVFDGFIASFFPAAASSGGGDISSFGSQFKTEQGGAIDLYAPQGSVYAGLTAGNLSKSAAEMGIFTVRGGALRSLVRKDFLVNTGRVFTLGGGDISLVSQTANIDAGRGAKTASSAPPPQISIDKDGKVSVDVSASISGSGIATLKTRPGQPNSNVYALAPRGIFDAGDAGVRSSGAVEVVAPIVRNADNISAAGPVVGASVGVAAPPAPVVAPANAAAKDDEATKAAANPAGNSSTLPLSVDALGFGPPCDPDKDKDCPADSQADDAKKTKNRK